jgi:hypothetical protein
MAHIQIPEHNQVNIRPGAKMSFCISLITLALLTGCGRAEYAVVNPESSPIPRTPTAVASTAIPTPYTPIVATGVPTYVYYGQVVRATAFAIAQVLPTPSPIPSAHPAIQEREKREYLADASMRTLRCARQSPCTRRLLVIGHLRSSPRLSSLPIRLARRALTSLPRMGEFTITHLKMRRKAR